MNQLLLENVLEVFPLEIKEGDIENDRPRIMRDFFYLFVVEFGVDLDHITRVQLCQNISGDDELISTINLMSCINSLIPGPLVGLLDLLAPSPTFFWKKMELCLRFYKFSDSVTSALFELNTPIVQSRKNIKQYNEGIADISSATSDTLVKIKHESRMLEEVEHAFRRNEDISVQLMDEKKGTENQIEITILDVNKKLRRKQQITTSLNELKNTFEMKKNRFKHNANCEEQRKGLFENFTEGQEKKSKIHKLIDQEKQIHKDLTEQNAILEKRYSLALQIYNHTAKIKELKEGGKKWGADKSVSENLLTEKLDGLMKEISSIEQDYVNILEAKASETEHLQNSIKSKMDSLGPKSKLLLKIRSEKKEVEPLLNKIRKQDISEQTLKQCYKEQEARLIHMEEKYMQNRRNQFEWYRKQALIISDAIKNE